MNTRSPSFEQTGKEFASSWGPGSHSNWCLPTSGPHPQLPMHNQVSVLKPPGDVRYFLARFPGPSFVVRICNVTSGRYIRFYYFFTARVGTRLLNSQQPLPLFILGLADAVKMKTGLLLKSLYLLFQRYSPLLYEISICSLSLCFLPPQNRKKQKEFKRKERSEKLPSKWTRVDGTSGQGSCCNPA